jgi:predicted RNase H-like nuclease (RuvC/YqgF family)
MAGATGLRYSYPQHETSSPGLLQRLGGDDFAELQACRQTIEVLQERVSMLDFIKNELEDRLEDQEKQCMTAEKECLDIRTEWTQKCSLLEKEIEDWKKEFGRQQLKSDRLREQCSRTERELYRIRGEIMRHGGTGKSANYQRKSSNDATSSGEAPNESFLAPHSMQSPEVRQKRVISSLMDFCGL